MFVLMWKTNWDVRENCKGLMISVPLTFIVLKKDAVKENGKPYLFIFNFEGTVPLRDGTDLSIKCETCLLFKILFSKFFFFYLKNNLLIQNVFIFYFTWLIFQPQPFVKTSSSASACPITVHPLAARAHSDLDRNGALFWGKAILLQDTLILSVSTFTFAVIGEL